jgi:2-methylaconitate cis-trans-isomerase PrpF
MLGSKNKQKPMTSGEAFRLPCVLMRGGSSRGPYFLESDLPSDTATRDRILIAAMGSPHGLQLDGIGGGSTLTSKVAIVSASKQAGADIDYLFAQVSVDSADVDTGPNCGNMLAGVGPFAIEAGLIAAKGDETTVRIFNRNTSAMIEAVVQTPGGLVTYEGNCRIDGVNGTAAPISLTFLDAEGSKTGRLLPTGYARDTLDGIEVSLVDYATPMLLLRATDLGITGSETPAEIDANKKLLSRIEAIRRLAGEQMGLGDVSGRVIPKVAILSQARKGGSITSRYLTPLQCHRSHAVTGALCIAVATHIAGSVASELYANSQDRSIEVEHPVGVIGIGLKMNQDGSVSSASLMRTARRIFEGHLMIPRHVFDESIMS